jgi:signal transduction histidine kinase
MEIGAEGDHSRHRFDALYEEAKQALGYAANQLRVLTEQARELHAEAVGGSAGAPGSDAVAGNGHVARRVSDELVRQRTVLARLDVVLRSLESAWLLLERGADGQEPLDGPVPVDPASRIRILEAQESERARLAQEIHDGPAQTLANSVFLADIVERSIGADPVEARRQLAELRALLMRDLGELRGLVNQLRPQLDPDGLHEALREAALATEQGVESPLTVEVDLGAPFDLLDANEQAVVLRVAQEALRNIRRHAHASRARLTSRLETGDSVGPAAWVLEVSDDGRGIDPSASDGAGHERHFGLRFMHERAEMIGARLDIESEATTGTTVRLTINGPERR